MVPEPGLPGILCQVCVATTALPLEMLPSWPLGSGVVSFSSQRAKPRSRKVKRQGQHHRIRKQGKEATAWTEQQVEHSIWWRTHNTSGAHIQGKRSLKCQGQQGVQGLPSPPPARPPAISPFAASCMVARLALHMQRSSL